MMIGVSVLSIAGMCVARARRNDDDHQYGMVWAKFTYMPSRLLLAGMLRDEPNAFWHHGIVAALLITQVGCVPLRLDGASVVGVSHERCFCMRAHVLPRGVRQAI